MMTCEVSLAREAAWLCAMYSTFNSIFFLDDMMTVADTRAEEEEEGGRSRGATAGGSDGRGLRRRDDWAQEGIWVYAQVS